MNTLINNSMVNNQYSNLQSSDFYSLARKHQYIWISIYRQTNCKMKPHFYSMVNQMKQPTTAPLTTLNYLTAHGTSFRQMRMKRLVKTSTNSLAFK